MSTLSIHEVLSRYWGYSTFRPMQEDIIRSVLSGRDTLALLPTGGGKSLCYQVPGMVVEGITLVITPLIALMKDQVENLRARGIPAEAVYSGMSPREVELAMNHVLHNQSRFLYLSPERLLTDRFKVALDHIKVGLIAVDEAHCISQWGYDFRPPYLRIAEIRERLPGVPVLALTATATKNVVQDIQDKLKFKQNNVFERSFERKNLAYVVFREENKINRLLRICANVKGTGIVYVRNRRKTREVAEMLLRNGIKADYYHAGLPPADRERKQNGWKSGAIRVMVSTNAFGMGIDKPDVRFVVHLDLPDTPEAYFQEAGRAGRDEKKSYAVLLFDEADIIDARRNFEMTYPGAEVIRNIYNALGNHLNLAPGTGYDTIHTFDINSFSNQYGFKPVVVYNSLKFIEREGYIIMNEAMTSHSKLVFNIRKDELYRFQVENAHYDPLIKTILRSYGGVFSEAAPISESELGKRLSVSETFIVQMLENLHKMQILTYIPQTDKPQIAFPVELVRAVDLRISPDVYKNRKKEAEMRLNAMINYATSSNHCRSRMLISYFGQPESRRCGICDVCLERNKAQLSELEFDNIIEVIKPMLKMHECSMEQIIAACSRISEEKVVNAVTWLVDNDKIELVKEGVFRWRKKDEVS